MSDYNLFKRLKTDCRRKVELVMTSAGAPEDLIDRANHLT